MTAALAKPRGTRECLWAERAERAERAEGAFAVAAGVACTSALFYFLVANDFRMTYVSGIWTALAVDFRHGILYRPELPAFFGPIYVWRWLCTSGRI